MLKILWCQTVKTHARRAVVRLVPEPIKRGVLLVQLSVRELVATCAMMAVQNLAGQPVMGYARAFVQKTVPAQASTRRIR